MSRSRGFYDHFILAEAAESWGIVRTWNQKRKKSCTYEEKLARKSNNFEKNGLTKTSKLKNVKLNSTDTNR
jgi:hypothetical protein